MKAEVIIDRLNEIIHAMQAINLKQWQAMEEAERLDEHPRLKQLLLYIISKNSTRKGRYFDDTPELSYSI